MPGIRVLIMLILFTFCAANGVKAQQVKPTQNPVAPPITVAGSGDRVRFTSPNSVVQMHLQVYDNAGQLVFDVSSKGNVLDWTLQDSGGARLNAGSYLSVVTVKSLSGKLSQRIGSVSVQEKQVELQRVDAMQMTAAQQQAVGPIEENGALMILKAGEPEAATVVAHDGTQGEISRSRGALSFRLGDFFSGKDAEQMRLTEAGNLGIGTDNPQAKLDVAGAIRTSEGIEFDNGTNVTKLTTTATGSLQQTLPDGTVIPNASGAGTTGRLTKWTDGPAGTLGDSVVTEASGKIGIGTPIPQAALHVNGNEFVNPVGATPTYKVLAGSDPSRTVMLTTDSSAFGWQIAPTNAASDTIVQVLGQSFAAVPNRGEFGIYLGTDANSAFKVIQRGGPELMRVDRTGNVGIGTTTPGSRLEINDSSNTGLRVVTLSAGGTVGSFGANGDFNVDSPGIPGGRFFVQENGNVGIGRAFPNGIPSGALAKLDIAGGADPGGFGDAKAIAFSYRFGGFRHWIRTRHNVSGGPGNAIDFFTNSSNVPEGSFAPGVGSQLVLTLDGGNVGIGKQNPSSRLHIDAPSSPDPISAMTIDVQSFQTPGNAVASHFFRVRDVFSGSASAFLIRGDGNIGIGVDSPNAKLQVQNGNVYVGTAGNGIILKAANGVTCRLLTVDVTGELLNTYVPCP